MKKLKRQGKRIAVSILAVAFALTGSVTQTALQASEVSTQNIITGEGYSFDPSNGALTVTENWGSDASITKTAVKTVDIKEGVTEITAWAFDNCSVLTNVTMSSRVTSIQNGAFVDINNLTLTMTGATPPTLGNDIFNNITTLTNKVPQGTESAYKNVTE